MLKQFLAGLVLVVGLFAGNVRAEEPVVVQAALEPFVISQKVQDACNEVVELMSAMLKKTFDENVEKCCLPDGTFSYNETLFFQVPAVLVEEFALFRANKAASLTTLERAIFLDFIDSYEMKHAFVDESGDEFDMEAALALAKTREQAEPLLGKALDLVKTLPAKFFARIAGLFGPYSSGKNVFENLMTDFYSKAKELTLEIVNFCCNAQDIFDPSVPNRDQILRIKKELSIVYKHAESAIVEYYQAGFTVFNQEFFQQHPEYQVDEISASCTRSEAIMWFDRFYVAIDVAKEAFFKKYFPKEFSSC